MLIILTNTDQVQPWGGRVEGCAGRVGQEGEGDGDADNADACADDTADNTAATDQCNTAQVQPWGGRGVGRAGWVGQEGE